MRFSVIIPVYNKAPHIRRSISSVLAQSYRDFELIAVDDGSNDGSFDILKEFNDTRIRIYSRNNPGPGGYAARNLAISNAQFEWISFLDADDEWDSNLLLRLKETTESFSEAEIVTCGWSWVDQDRTTQRDIFKNTGLQKNAASKFNLANFLKNPDLMWTGAVSMKKDLIVSAGMFPTDSRCKKGGDLDTWIRCLQKSKGNVHINENLAYYYRDTVNRVTSHKHNPTSHFCAYESVKKIYDTSPDSFLRSAIRHFVNKNIFLITINQIDAGYPIDSHLLKKMLPTPRALYYLIRIVFQKILNIIDSNRPRKLEG